jgi:2-keto-4-pentenoate hydratase
MVNSEGGERRNPAKRLRNAYVSGPVPPLRAVLEPTDAASAYRIQSLNTEFWRASG